MDKKSFEQYRYFLKDSVRLMIDFHQTDQNLGRTPPAIEKAYSEDDTTIDLVPVNELKNIPEIDLVKAIGDRKSHRKFLNQPLNLDELSLLLWATQGIRKKINEAIAYRTVPSAGCRHSFETYLCVLNVSGLEHGIYRYLPSKHQLLFERTVDNLGQVLVKAALGQPFFGKAPVSFIWTTIPYRMEWRYGIAAHKVIAIDAGHVCQNLYLACEAINAGTCAVAAYNQILVDKLLEVDGDEEFTIYMAPVGKI